MKRLAFLPVLFQTILVVLIIACAAGGCYFFQKGMSFYKPGSLAEDFRDSLTPPSQAGVEESFWKVKDDIKLYYFTQGIAEIPVLVIHGGPGVPPSKAWDGLEALGNTYMFYYYHQCGCGKSTRPIDKFDSRNYFQNMTELNDKLGIAQQIADMERVRQILVVRGRRLLGTVDLHAFIAKIFWA